MIPQRIQKTQHRRERFAVIIDRVIAGLVVMTVYTIVQWMLGE